MLTEVNAAAVQWSNVSLPGEASSSKGSEESAEAIVVGLKRVGGQRMPELNNETRGATTQRRAEPMRRRTTP